MMLTDVTFSNHGGRILLGGGWDRWETYTKTSTNPAVCRKVTIYLRPDTAEEMIKLLGEYVEYRKDHPREVRE